MKKAVFNLSVLAIVLLPAMGVVIPPSALGNIGRCGTLLAKAATEPDPLVIQATLFQTLAVDYRVLYSTRSMILLTETLHREFPSDLHFHLKPTRGYGILYIHKAPLSFIKRFGRTLRNLAVDEPRQAERIATSIWESLRDDFLVGDRLETYAKYPVIARADFDDVEQVIRTVDGDPALRRAALALIEENVTRIDEWIFTLFRNPLPSWLLDSYMMSDHWTATVAQVGKARAKLALPTMKSRLKSRKALPPLSVDFAPLERAFAIAETPERLKTHEGILFFDREVMENCQKLSAYVVTIRDQLASYAGWNRFFDVAADWALLAEKAKTNTPKAEFLAVSTATLGHLDDQARAFRHGLSTIEVALEQIERKIQLLEAVTSPGESPIQHDHRRTLGRLRELEGEMKKLRMMVTDLTTKTERGSAYLTQLRAKIATGPLAIEDPARFRADLLAIQATLDLDPALIGRLNKSSWWPWKWF